MIHSMLFDAAGAATYSNRFVQTQRLVEERKAGKQVFLRVRKPTVFSPCFDDYLRRQTLAQDHSHAFCSCGMSVTMQGGAPTCARQVCRVIGLVA